jgi:molybdate transport system ATP-binding protein
MNSKSQTTELSSIAVDIKFKRQSFHLDVDIEIPVSGVTAIFGPSGCGKTSLLRCIAGLDTPDSGHIRFGNKYWFKKNAAMATDMRAIGFVFQQSQLFPHLTVRQNLDFSNKMTRRAFDPVEFESLIQLLDIEKLLIQYPHTLSGGERQRVAIARALLRRPSMLLFDEPLASLDDRRKNKILDYLIQLKHRLSIPIVYVTHSRQEVVKLADHIIIMAQGKVERQGPVESLVDQLSVSSEIDKEPFVVWFGQVRASEDARIDRIKCGEVDIRVAGGLAISQGDCRLRLYAKDVSIATKAVEESSILNILAMQIESIEEIAGSHQVMVSLINGPQTLLAKISSFSLQNLNLHIGMNVFAQIKAISILA